MVRFLQQFDNGSGDYVKERRAWVEQTSIDDIVKLAQARRKSAKKRASSKKS